MIDKAGERATEVIMEQMERELLGAWRAGYDWLHVYDEVPSGRLSRDDLSESFTIRQYVFPANSKRPPRPDDVRYRHSYDLRDVTKAEIDGGRR